MTVAVPGVTMSDVGMLAVSFPAQLVLTPSASMTVALQNTGDLLRTINGIVFVGANTGDFTQTNDCAGGRSGGSICSINVTFTPSTTGTRTAALKIIDSAADSPHMISVSGAGTTDFSISTLLNRRQ